MYEEAQERGLPGIRIVPVRRRAFYVARKMFVEFWKWRENGRGAVPLGESFSVSHWRFLTIAGGDASFTVVIAQFKFQKQFVCVAFCLEARVGAAAAGGCRPWPLAVPLVGGACCLGAVWHPRPPLGVWERQFKFSFPP